MEYQLAQETWKDTDLVSVFTKNDQFIAEFPLSFIRFGRTDSWRYVHLVVLDLLQAGTQGHLEDYAGQALDLDAVVTPGDFVFVTTGNRLPSQSRCSC